MAIRIDDDFMSAGSAGRVIATARYSEDAAADGHGAWAVSYRPSHLFTRDQAITAMVLAERLAAGYGDDDPFVIVRGKARSARWSVRGPRWRRLARLSC